MKDLVDAQAFNMNMVNGDNGGFKMEMMDDPSTCFTPNFAGNSFPGTT